MGSISSSATRITGKQTDGKDGGRVLMANGNKKCFAQITILSMECKSDLRKTKAMVMIQLLMDSNLAAGIIKVTKL